MIIAIIVFAILLCIGMPIAIALGLFGMAHIATMGNPAFFDIIVGRLFSGVNILSISCIPFFLMAGELMNGGGITKRMLDFLRTFLGRIHGGMAYCTVALSAILSAILGSAQANASLLNQILPDEMADDGYPRDYTGALISAASVLGPIIPPSTMFIFYCYLTDVSIKYMFIAGIIPGIILALAYCVTIFIQTRKGSKLNMDIKKPESKFSWKEFGRTLVKAIPALCVPVIIIGGVLTGFCTAIEAGAVACIAAFIVSLIYREIKFKKIPEMMFRAAISTGSIFMIIAFGNIIAWAMAKGNVADTIISFITAITSNKYIILFIILLILVLVGCVLDMASATLIFIPVMFPIIQTLGIDVVHFGIIFSLMITIGMITPPVGQVLFITTNVSKVSFEDLVKKIWPFVFASFLTTFILAYLPDVVLLLPKVFGYTG